MHGQIIIITSCSRVAPGEGEHSDQAGRARQLLSTPPGDTDSLLPSLEEVWRHQAQDWL